MFDNRPDLKAIRDEYSKGVAKLTLKSGFIFVILRAALWMIF
jgi:hypothetical protein